MAMEIYRGQDELVHIEVTRGEKHGHCSQCGKIVINTHVCIACEMTMVEMSLCGMEVCGEE